MLDLGCGTGRDCSLFLSEGLRYVGIDFSRQMLSVAERDFAREIQEGRAGFLQMNMCELTLAPESVDGFLAITSFMHIPKPNVLIALREVRRVLKSGGAGFIALPMGEYNGMYEGEESGGRKTLSICWTVDDLSAVLDEAGFSVADVSVFDCMILCIVEKK